MDKAGERKPLENHGGLIRAARPLDARAMLAIYAPYVEETAISFELLVPAPEEFKGRVEKCLQRYPWLLFEREGEILGYAYMGPFKSRAAYDHSAEVSIYVRRDQKGRGIGRRLYEALEKIAGEMGLTNLYACISWPIGEDDHLTRESVSFHSHMGYVLAGHYHQCGCKFDRWYDMVWMEKMIAPHPENGGEIMPLIPWPQCPSFPEMTKSQAVRP